MKLFRAERFDLLVEKERGVLKGSRYWMRGIIGACLTKK